jgi:arylsulfatase A-like enzyme
VTSLAAGTGFAALGARLALPGQETPGGKPPNLLIVMVDQMRGQAMGFMGEDPVVTPYLDRFAAESLVLTHAVSNYPVCSPTRAMLMTGAYPLASKVIGNCNSQTTPFGCELPASARCWSDVLADRGYSLGYMGKWHLDSLREPYIDCSNNRGKLKWNEWCSPDRRHGFDYWYAYGTYDMHMNPMYWSTHAKRGEFKYVKQWGPEHEADLAIRYINNEGGQFRKQDKPFALMVSMNPPHTPYNQFPERYLAPYEGKTEKDLIVRPNVDTSGETKMSKHALKHTKNYFANVTGVDHQFGRIVEALDQAGLAEDTVVVFTSDHGNCVGSHDLVTKNNHFEESMRVPLLIRWPGRITARHDDLLISYPDLYPTFLALMGLEKEIPGSVQGVSHAGLFLTGEGKRPTSQLYLKIPFDHPDFGRRGVRTHSHKLMLNKEPDKPMEAELYDLRSDPCELENLASANPETMEKLIREELRPWLEKTDDAWIRHLDKEQDDDSR